MNMLLPLRSPWKKLVVLLFLLLLPGRAVFSQPFSYSRSIRWETPRYVRISGTDSVVLLTFPGAIFPDNNPARLPLYHERFRLSSVNDGIASLALQNPVFQPLNALEEKAIPEPDKIPAAIAPGSGIIIQKKLPYAEVEFMPFRRNEVTGQVEKLVSFNLVLEIDYRPGPSSVKSTGAFASNSVLSAGTWYKIAVSSTGIYRISYSDLVGAGINVTSLDPRNIRIFGNGGGMLPESNSIARIDDLEENSIYVEGEQDGIFDPSDYILFYGESPDTWTYDSQNHIFHHKKNLYSDQTCYFLTIDNGPGKRIGTESSITSTPTNIITTFNDYAFYQKNDLNLIKSGKEWYDQEWFELSTVRNYQFSFPNIYHVIPATIWVDVAARSTTGITSFSVSVNDQSVASVQIPPTTTDYLDKFAVERTAKGNFSSSDPTVNVKLTFGKNSSGDIGYLNYIELNALDSLRMSGSQLSFRSVLSAGPGKTAEFHLNTNGNSVRVWSVTDRSEINQINGLQNNNTFIFRVTTDSLREFIAFDGSSYNSVQSITRIDNQNLHGVDHPDMVIVSFPDFITEANRLADFHRQHDGLTVLVTTPAQVYNEFSSGTQDVCAVRDFMKMLYDRAPAGQEPKYLMLFGDASYDYKDRLTSNTNFVPTFESAESLDPVETFVTDDFFGILDNNEGLDAAGEMDIGVGRFPVDNADEANQAIDKVLHYMSNTDSVKNDWRNELCFVADDEDGNLHMEQTEGLTSLLEGSHQEYNIDKIYLDAFQQVSTPGGNRYPDVNAAINQEVAKGALVMNYVGHGGELGWAAERVLEIPDILSWSNFDKMPIFVTATCEFTRFDDPGWVSAGEEVFLNSGGGGVALFTTTRPTFAGSNYYLTTNFYSHAFNKTNGSYPTMGDLIVLSKQGISGSSNTKKFVLLGDPAMRMAYPQYHVFTTSINGKPSSGTEPDTLKALMPVVIAGEVRDDNGSLMSGFNGTVFTTVYDKSVETVTLANDGGTPFQFYLRKNILYKGKTNVTNGQFSFSFIVPKDIAYQYGGGKISYYARSAETDANGYDENVIVGGYENSSVVDTAGPSMKLYMNDTTFTDGGLTDQNPILLARIVDPSGINTVGSGIGHDITAVLDGNTKDLLILNDYYQADLGTYTKGYISYPFFNLSDGWHTVTLKVWDVYNNSAEATLTFQVVSDIAFEIRNLVNFPNPMRDHTTFSFQYNYPNENLDVSISIYSMTGGLVKTIRQNIMTSGYQITEIAWDGRDDHGAMVGSGIYAYYVHVSTAEGGTAWAHSKLVFLR